MPSSSRPPTRNTRSKGVVLEGTRSGRGRGGRNRRLEHDSNTNFLERDIAFSEVPSFSQNMLSTAIFQDVESYVIPPLSYDVSSSQNVAYAEFSVETLPVEFSTIEYQGRMCPHLRMRHF